MTTEATENKINEKTAELEVTARLMGVPVNTREICDKWLLLTYDMPHTEAGDKARREFLVQARALGAMQHTESVYLIPFSPAAELAAIELSKAGKVIIWTSQTTSPEAAKEVTKTYDDELKGFLKKLSERVHRMLELKKDAKYGIFNKMVEKTDAMMADMRDAVERRGNPDLDLYFRLIKATYDIL